MINLLNEIFKEKNLISMIISSKKNKEIEFNKIQIKPFLKKDEILYQFSYIYDKKTIHKNMNENEAKEEILNLIKNCFSRGNIFTTKADYQIISNNNIKIIKSKASKIKEDFSHNRKKNYLVEDGKFCDFLYKLDVMDKEGKVYKSKYDKFRQINKYLEIMESTIKMIDTSKELKIVDFGSGKSYLTFALYWYMTQKLNLKVKIMGLDLKEDVIKFCNKIAKELNYENLSFKIGNIKVDRL